MRPSYVLGIAFAALAALHAAPGGAGDLDSYLWTARPVVVFADSPRDPRFVAQAEALDAADADLDERGVVVLTDADPAANGPLRRRLRPRGFQIVLIGKDGQIKFRRPHPISAEDLNRQIDRSPMRRREMRGGQG